MTITIVMTFELNFYVLPTEVLLIMAIFFIFDRTVGILFSSKKKSANFVQSRNALATGVQCKLISKVRDAISTKKEEEDQMCCFIRTTLRLHFRGCHPPL
jgi:hypothetical protein